MTLNSFSPRRFKAAPLPFVGQKRGFIRPFGELLLANIANDGQGFTIVDVFGGSGLLAHTAKHLLPRATVIYNDFDNYTERLAHIDDTNRLRRLLFSLLENEPRSKALSDTARKKAADLITHFDGFVDVQTLAGWLLFSGCQVSNLSEFLGERWYNRIKKSDYAEATGYLDGLIITNQDYLTTLKTYKDTPNCVLLLDPPYLCSSQGAYAKADYFGLTQFLILMHYVRPPYVFFSSTRSELLSFMAYLQVYDDKAWQRLGGFDNICIKASVNYNSVYEDNMLFKF